jgi:hypothetical protein
MTLQKQKSMRTNTFFTIFIAVYLLCGVMLYEVLSLTYTDEIMVLLLVLYTGFRWAGSKKKLDKETKWFGAIALFYLFYSFCIGTTSTKAVLLDFQQQIKPYLAFYCTAYLAPSFTARQQKRLHLYIDLLSIGVGIILLAGLTKLFFGGFTAILATVMLTLSLFHYYMGLDTGLAKKKSLLIMSLGVLSAKAKFFSEYIMAIYFFLFRKTKLKLTSLKTILPLVLLGALIVYVIWEKLNFYYIEGMSDSEGIARPLLYHAGIQILADYLPFGSGFGTFCNDAARTVYSPLYYTYNLYTVYGLSPDNPNFATDCFYPTLSQFGVVGIYLFILFWCKRYRQIKESSDMKSYLTGYMAMVIILFDAVADSSYLSNRGLPFFILLGLIAQSGIQKRGSIHFVNNLKQ